MSEPDTVYVLEEVKNGGNSTVVGVFTHAEEMHAYKDDKQPDLDSRRKPINWRWSEQKLITPAGESDE